MTSPAVRIVVAAVTAVGLALPAAAAEAPAALGEAPRRDLASCVAVAVAGSGTVAEAEGKVAEWRGRLAEVRSVFYPKISAIAFAAPIFGYRGSPLAADVERQYDVWGPYLSFQGLLMQPIYTFGRASAGEKAAQERLAVEEARLTQTRNAVALEVARYYYLHLYVATLRPTLDSARKLLNEAQEKAQEMYEEGSGKVTQADLQKLKYVSAELDKYLVQAEFAHGLSLAALKHTMGRPELEPLALADKLLPPAPGVPIPELPVLVQRAWEKRPEVSQLKHGREAAMSLEEAERLANYPVVALVGQLEAKWTPVRTHSPNPFHYDPYNQLNGGVAVAMQFDLDPAKAKAKGDTAQALVEQVDGLAKFASTGIPLEVRKCRDDLAQAERILAVSDAGTMAAKKWMVFAAAAYTAGTGETKDMLEGLGAFMQAKKGSADALLNVHMARAQLSLATGEIVEHLGQGLGAGSRP